MDLRTVLFIGVVIGFALVLIFGPKWQRQYVAAVAGALGVVLVFGVILALTAERRDGLTG